MSYTPIGYTDVQIQALIDDGYIPIHHHSDLNAIRDTYSGSTRIFASGTKYDTGEINTLGPADKYVQVSNIDLYAETRTGGVYDNASAGWNPIGLGLTGTYDGGGFLINGMYINRSANYIGLFRYIGNGGIIRNVSNINFTINAAANYVGGIAGMALGTISYIKNCLSHGVINHTGETWAGGILGARNIALTHIIGIEDCFSAVDILSTGSLNGGIAGQISEATSYIKNCISIGKITGDSSSGLVGYAEHDAEIIYSYYNKETTPDSDSVTGAKTTDELINGTPSNSIYVDWGSDWVFASNKYPRIAITDASIAVNKPPIDLLTVIDSNDDIALSWDLPHTGFLGYNIYVDDVKVNTELITDPSYEYTPLDSGSYNIYVKAVFKNRSFTWESGPCNIKNDSYYLPALVRVDGNDVIIADKRDEDNSDHYTTISLPVAKEFEGVEANIALTDSSFTAGTAVGIWYGTGTEIYREFEDTKRLITQTITVTSRSVKIVNTVQYKQSIQIDYEGFELTGFVGYGRDRNVYGSGTGQCIINNTGMFFHHGDYTDHKVLAGIDIDYMYKEYALNDEETCTLYLMDGRDNIPCRVLYQPDGYDASFTISNHADGASLERQRAVYYGASDVNDPEYGRKGMAAHGIVADWSVFAKEASGVTAFENDPAYLSFLQGLVSIGNDVIPHSTASGQDHATDAATYLPDYKDNFGCKNWIDHDLAGGNVTLGIHSKGWDVTDETNYMMDEFEDNGFEQAWAYEEFDNDRVESTTWGFGHDIAFFNDHLVMPSGQKVLLWKSSNRPIYYGYLNLDDLINNCGSIDAHEYIANTSREASTDDLSFTKTHYDDDGTLRITTGYELLLGQIAEKKSSGEIWNPTNEDWNEYFIKLKNVIVNYTNADTLSINNTGSSVDGFSILIYKKGISATLNSAEMSSKEVYNGTIFWGNLNAGVNSMIIV